MPGEVTRAGRETYPLRWEGGSENHQKGLCSDLDSMQKGSSPWMVSAFTAASVPFPEPLS